MLCNRNKTVETERQKSFTVYTYELPCNFHKKAFIMKLFNRKDLLLGVGKFARCLAPRSHQRKGNILP